MKIYFPDRIQSAFKELHTQHGFRATTQSYPKQVETFRGRGEKFAAISRSKLKRSTRDGDIIWALSVHTNEQETVAQVLRKHGVACDVCDVMHDERDVLILRTNKGPIVP